MMSASPTEVQARPPEDATPHVRPAAAAGLIRDPREIPVVGVDDHLPPVSVDRLQVASLRQRFSVPTDWRPEFSGDGRPVMADRQPRAASVLVALIDRPGGLHVLLTRRTDHLKDHAGQVSFPGGRAEAYDADAQATALREAEEEVGLHAKHVQVIGQLPTYRTITAYEVTPVVALVTQPPALTLDPNEVAESFEVPLSFLMTPKHHRRHAFEVDGHRRQFLSMPWHGTGSLGKAREYFIWGATAAMLRNFYGFLSSH